MRSYLVDALRRGPGPPEPRPRRLIALEVRIRDPFGSIEELAMVPVDLELPPAPNAGMRWELPCTLHTSWGDVNVTIDLPAHA